jgi:hypothetical protein
MTRKILILTLFLLAVSGFMLHYRVHYFLIPDRFNPGQTIFDSTRFLASLLPLIDAILVTALFMWRKTAVYGYVLNGMIVIVGTVMMAHFSLAQFITNNVPPSQWIIRSTLPDIGIAWCDFLVGKAIYDLYMKEV